MSKQNSHEITKHLSTITILSASAALHITHLLNYKEQHLSAQNEFHFMFNMHTSGI